MSEWECWVVYSWDTSVIVEAIFPDEIDALRYAVYGGYPMNVKRVEAGNFRDQIK